MPYLGGLNTSGARGDAFLPALARIALPGIIGGIRRIARVGATSTAAVAAAEVFRPGTLVPPPMGQIPVPGARGAIQRALPGGESGFMPKKRRRTNFSNPRALSRAIRRVEGFGRLVARSKKAVSKANTQLNPRRGGVAARKRG